MSKLGLKSFRHFANEGFKEIEKWESDEESEATSDSRDDGSEVKEKNFFNDRHVRRRVHQPDRGLPVIAIVSICEHSFDCGNAVHHCSVVQEFGQALLGLGFSKKYYLLQTVTWN